MSLWRRDWEAALAASRSASLEERLQQQLLAATAELEKAHAQLATAREAGFDMESTRAEMARRAEKERATRGHAQTR